MIYHRRTRSSRVYWKLYSHCLVAGCAAFSGCGEEPSPYNWEVSIVDSFDPEQCCLKELPWLITMDEAKEILHLADLPADAYEVGKYGDLSMVLKNVKLKEFQLPMELSLKFRKNPGMTGKKGVLLTTYTFNVPELDGYSLLEKDSLPLRMLPEETQEKLEQILGADMQACVQALAQRPDIAAAIEDMPGHENFSYGISSDGLITSYGAKVTIPDERFGVFASFQLTQTGPVFWLI